MVCCCCSEIPDLIYGITIKRWQDWGLRQWSKWQRWVEPSTGETTASELAICGRKPLENAGVGPEQQASS